MQTPSGSNRQAWQWMFVANAAKRRALADFYRKQFDATYRIMPVAEFDGPVQQAQAARRRESATWPTTSSGYRSS